MAITAGGQTRWLRSCSRPGVILQPDHGYRGRRRFVPLPPVQLASARAVPDSARPHFVRDAARVPGTRRQQRVSEKVRPVLPSQRVEGGCRQVRVRQRCRWWRGTGRGSRSGHPEGSSDRVGVRPGGQVVVAVARRPGEVHECETANVLNCSCSDYCPACYCACDFARLRTCSGRLVRSSSGSGSHFPQPLEQSDNAALDADPAARSV